MSSSSTNAYRPGACNIGSSQRRRRHRLGVATLGVAVAYAAAGAAGVFPDALIGGVFVPLALGLELVVQAKESFCARLAYLGRYDFSDDSAGDDWGETDDRADRVADPAHRHADRLRAARITAAAVTTAAAATLALVLAV